MRKCSHYSQGVAIVHLSAEKEQGARWRHEKNTCVSPSRTPFCLAPIISSAFYAGYLLTSYVDHWVPRGSSPVEILKMEKITFSRDVTSVILGSFSNDDGDGNEDVKKAIGLLSKTTTLHVHHAFLYISLPSLHDYDVKMPNCKFYGGRKQATTNLFFSH